MTKIALTLLLSICFAAPMFAGEGDEKKTEAVPVEKSGTVTTGGGMIYTTEAARGVNGELPQELTDALSDLVNTSSEGLVEEHLSDGTVMVDLKGRFQSAMVVSIDSSGKLQSGCYSSTPGKKCGHEHSKTADVAAEKEQPKK